MKRFIKKSNEGGLPKAQAIFVSFMIALCGYFILRRTSYEPNWVNINSFFLVWIVFTNMLHNKNLDTLPKVNNTYTFKIEEKDFIDEVDFILYLSAQGSMGWEAVSIRQSTEVNERYKIIFKKTNP